jgi:hypothetical protein
MTRARTLAGFVTAINVSNDLFVGIVTGTSFIGDGTGLTGVASTDYIITGTAATFNNTTTFNNTARFNGGILDAGGSLGVNGYVLKTDGADIDWVDPTTVSGLQGVQGIQGTQGTQGTTGTTGTQGTTGTSGSATLTNVSDNRVMTAVSGTTLNAEANLTFDGSTLTVTGDVSATGNVNSGSDINLKTDIETVEDAVSIINQIRGVKFRWKETDQASVGIIAQELETVLPELVHVSAGGTKTVTYNGLIGVLVQAVKELKSEIEELKKTR